MSEKKRDIFEMLQNLQQIMQDGADLNRRARSITTKGKKSKQAGHKIDAPPPTSHIRPKAVKKATPNVPVGARLYPYAEAQVKPKQESKKVAAPRKTYKEVKTKTQQNPVSLHSKSTIDKPEHPKYISRQIQTDEYLCENNDSDSECALYHEEELKLRRLYARKYLPKYFYKWEAKFQNSLAKQNEKIEKQHIKKKRRSLSSKKTKPIELPEKPKAPAKLVAIKQIKRYQRKEIPENPPPEKSKKVINKRKKSTSSKRRSSIENSPPFVPKVKKSAEEALRKLLLSPKSPRSPKYLREHQEPTLTITPKADKKGLKDEEETKIHYTTPKLNNHPKTNTEINVSKPKTKNDSHSPRHSTIKDTWKTGHSKQIYSPKKNTLQVDDEINYDFYNDELSSNSMEVASKDDEFIPGKDKQKYSQLNALSTINNPSEEESKSEVDLIFNSSNSDKEPIPTISMNQSKSPKSQTSNQYKDNSLEEILQISSESAGILDNEDLIINEKPLYDSVSEGFDNISDIDDDIIPQQKLPIKNQKKTEDNIIKPEPLKPIKMHVEKEEEHISPPRSFDEQEKIDIRNEEDNSLDIDFKMNSSSSKSDDIKDNIQINYEDPERKEEDIIYDDQEFNLSIHSSDDHIDINDEVINSDSNNDEFVQLEEQIIKDLENNKLSNSIEEELREDNGIKSDEETKIDNEKRDSDEIDVIGSENSDNKDSENFEPKESDEDFNINISNSENEDEKDFITSKIGPSYEDNKLELNQEEEYGIVIDNRESFSGNEVEESEDDYINDIVVDSASEQDNSKKDEYELGIHDSDDEKEVIGGDDEFESSDMKIVVSGSDNEEEKDDELIHFSPGDSDEMVIQKQDKTTTKKVSNSSSSEDFNLSQASFENTVSIPSDQIEDFNFNIVNEDNKEIESSLSQTQELTHPMIPPKPLENENEEEQVDSGPDYLFAEKTGTKQSIGDKDNEDISISDKSEDNINISNSDDEKQKLVDDNSDIQIDFNEKQDEVTNHNTSDNDDEFDIHISSSDSDKEEQKLVEKLKNHKSDEDEMNFDEQEPEGNFNIDIDDDDQENEDIKIEQKVEEGSDVDDFNVSVSDDEEENEFKLSHDYVVNVEDIEPNSEDSITPPKPIIESPMTKHMNVNDKEDKSDDVDFLNDDESGSLDSEKEMKNVNIKSESSDFHDDIKIDDINNEGSDFDINISSSGNSDNEKTIDLIKPSDDENISPPELEKKKSDIDVDFQFSDKENEPDFITKPDSGEENIDLDFANSSSEDREDMTNSIDIKQAKEEEKTDEDNFNIDIDDSEKVEQKSDEDDMNIDVEVDNFNEERENEDIIIEQKVENGSDMDDFNVSVSSDGEENEFKLSHDYVVNVEDIEPDSEDSITPPKPTIEASTTIQTNVDNKSEEQKQSDDVDFHESDNQDKSRDNMKIDTKSEPSDLYEDIKIDDEDDERIEFYHDEHKHEENPKFEDEEDFDINVDIDEFKDKDEPEQNPDKGEEESDEDNFIDIDDDEQEKEDIKAEQKAEDGSDVDDFNVSVSSDGEVENEFKLSHDYVVNVDEIEPDSEDSITPPKPTIEAPTVSTPNAEEKEEHNEDKFDDVNFLEADESDGNNENEEIQIKSSSSDFPDEIKIDQDDEDFDVQISNSDNGKEEIQKSDEDAIDIDFNDNEIRNNDASDDGSDFNIDLSNSNDSDKEHTKDLTKDEIKATIDAKQEEDNDDAFDIQVSSSDEDKEEQIQKPKEQPISDDDLDIDVDFNANDEAEQKQNQDKGEEESDEDNFNIDIDDDQEKEDIKIEKKVEEGSDVDDFNVSVSSDGEENEFKLSHDYVVNVEDIEPDSEDSITPPKPTIEAPLTKQANAEDRVLEDGAFPSDHQSVSSDHQEEVNIDAVSDGSDFDIHISSSVSGDESENKAPKANDPSHRHEDAIEFGDQFSDDVDFEAEGEETKNVVDQNLAKGSDDDFNIDVNDDLKDDVDFNLSDEKVVMSNGSFQVSDEEAELNETLKSSMSDAEIDRPHNSNIENGEIESDDDDFNIDADEVDQEKEEQKSDDDDMNIEVEIDDFNEEQEKEDIKIEHKIEDESDMDDFNVSVSSDGEDNEFKLSHDYVVNVNEIEPDSEDSITPPKPTIEASATTQTNVDNKSEEQKQSDDVDFHESDNQDNSRDNVKIDTKSESSDLYEDIKINDYEDFNINVDIDEFKDEAEQKQNQDKGEEESDEDNFNIDIDDDDQENEDIKTEQKAEEGSDVDDFNVSVSDDGEENEFKLSHDYVVNVDEIEPDSEDSITPPKPTIEAPTVSTPNAEEKEEHNEDKSDDVDFEADESDGNNENEEIQIKSSSSDFPDEIKIDQDDEDFDVQISSSDKDKEEQNQKEQQKSDDDLDIDIDFNDNDGQEKEGEKEKEESDEDNFNIDIDDEQENEDIKTEQKAEDGSDMDDFNVSVSDDDEEENEFKLSHDYVVNVDEIEPDSEDSITPPKPTIEAPLTKQANAEDRVLEDGAFPSDHQSVSSDHQEEVNIDAVSDGSDFDIHISSSVSGDESENKAPKANDPSHRHEDAIEFGDQFSDDVDFEAEGEKPYKTVDQPKDNKEDDFNIDGSESDKIDIQIDEENDQPDHNISDKQESNDDMFIDISDGFDNEVEEKVSIPTKESEKAEEPEEVFDDFGDIEDDDDQEEKAQTPNKNSPYKIDDDDFQIDLDIIDNENSDNAMDVTMPDSDIEQNEQPHKEQNHEDDEDNNDFEDFEDNEQEANEESDSYLNGRFSESESDNDPQFEFEDIQIVEKTDENVKFFKPVENDEEEEAKEVLIEMPKQELFKDDSDDMNFDDINLMDDDEDGF